MPLSSPRSSSGDLYATDWGRLIFADGSCISSLINPVKTPAFFKTAISSSVIAMLPCREGDQGEGVNQARRLATDWIDVPMDDILLMEELERGCNLLDLRKVMFFGDSNVSELMLTSLILCFSSKLRAFKNVMMFPFL